MKKLLFIDNDQSDKEHDDMGTVQNMLEAYCKLPSDYVSTMEYLGNFAHKNQSDMMAKLFSGDYAICTFSMYTASHYNSLGQMLRFLRAAASAEIKNLVYIDGSRKFEEDIGSVLKEAKETMHILSGIETNNIITFTDTEAVRVRVEIKGLWDSPFKLEKVNLKTILK